MTELSPLTAFASSDVPALDAQRREAADHLAAHGLPTAKTENWKYTRLKTLEQLIARPVSVPDLTALPDTVMALDGAVRIVTVNGRLIPALSDLAALPAGLTAAPLTDADIDADMALPADQLPLAALNTLRFSDGVVLRIAPGATIDAPIHLISLGAGAPTGTACYPRLVLELGDNAEAVLLETHQDGGPGAVFIDEVLTLRLGRDARLRHYRHQDQGAETVHVASLAAQLAAGSVYENCALQTGTATVRNDIRLNLAGRHIDVRLGGVTIGVGGAHTDTTTFVDHAAPDSRSRQVYKGVLNDRARGVFQGKVLVRPGAQNTDAHQLNRTLLLSPGAEMDSKPELEIYADDVRCAHGATCGALDAMQLFYLRARGIDLDRARELLIRAFLIEVTDGISHDAIAARFTAALDHKLGRQDT